jgi:hypothetical protein
VAGGLKEINKLPRPGRKLVNIKRESSVPATADEFGAASMFAIWVRGSALVVDIKVVYL